MAHTFSSSGMWHGNVVSLSCQENMSWLLNVVTITGNFGNSELHWVRPDEAATLNPYRLFLIHLRRLIISKKSYVPWALALLGSMLGSILEAPRASRGVGNPSLCGTVIICGNNPNVGLSLMRICVVWRFETHFRLGCTSCHRFFSKYWCHIFHINFELDVNGFATSDYSGIFN